LGIGNDRIPPPLRQIHQGSLARQEIQSVILCVLFARLEKLPAPPSAKVLCQLAGLEPSTLAELHGMAPAVADEAATHARHVLHFLVARKVALLELAAQIELR
jgi:hypothetical protein